MGERIATIDIGTNTALLLIAESTPGGISEVFNAAGFVRLGEGMDASGRVGDAALGRLRSVLTSHMEHIRSMDPTRVVVTGTSASRDAADAYRIRDLVREVTGSDLLILSGEEEAQTTFDGAVCGMMSFDVQWSAVSEHGIVSVIDVGGGSTELVQGDPESGEIIFKKSIDMGSVRMTERFFSTQPVPVNEMDTARSVFQEMMAVEWADSVTTPACIGASGTAVILGRIQKDVRTLKELAGDSHMSLIQLEEKTSDILQMTRSKVLSLHPEKMKGREDVFPAGVLILNMATQFVGGETLYISPFGVRHGVAIAEFRKSR